MWLLQSFACMFDASLQPQRKCSDSSSVFSTKQCLICLFPLPSGHIKQVIKLGETWPELLNLFLTSCFYQGPFHLLGPNFAARSWHLLFRILNLVLNTWLCPQTSVFLTNNKSCFQKLYSLSKKVWIVSILHSFSIVIWQSGLKQCISFSFSLCYWDLNSRSHAC
jgi:hypothetical protein